MDAYVKEDRVPNESRVFDGMATLITGAASGIGRGVAEHFAALGARVAVVDLKAQEAEAVAAGIAAAGGEARAYAADVADASAVTAMVGEVASDFATSDRPRFVSGSIGPGQKLPSLGPFAPVHRDPAAPGPDHDLPVRTAGVRRCDGVGWCGHGAHAALAAGGPARSTRSCQSVLIGIPKSGLCVLLPCTHP